MRLFSTFTLHHSTARVLAMAVAFGGLALASGTAKAQVAGTANSPLPDVLLLVDTSGSMERMVNGKLPKEDPASKCTPGTSSTPNRWGMLVQALTGTMQPFYSCFDYDRSSAAFQNQYKIGNDAAHSATYDKDYTLPYHRPLSGVGTDVCALAPYNMPGVPDGSGVGLLKKGAGGFAIDFPDDAILAVTHSSNVSGGVVDPTNACLFRQAADGQLDVAKDFVRFALMTFDNDPDPGIGVSSADDLRSLTATALFTYPPPTPPPPTPPTPSCTTSSTSPLLGAFAGTWSYPRHNVITGTIDYTLSTNAAGSLFGSFAQGHPNVANCCSTPQEVGARNEGAPPWEGRLVRFPNPSETVGELERTNEQIQKVLLSSRPYGATPIDAMLDDARDYYRYYNTPSSTTNDQFSSCRDRYIVLLTDGAPNLDLRPSCTSGALPSTGPGLTCPYPENGGQIANVLANAGAGQKVSTFVIGFAVSGENVGVTGDGFPSAIPTTARNCKGWFEDGSTSGGNNNPTTLHNYCQDHQPGGPLSPTVPTGSTAAACCALNEIALQGSSGPGDTKTGAFFAESQADVSLAFGIILSKITRAATTRTTPVYTPPSTAATLAGGTAYAEFVGSFIPSAQRPWSGELDRTRFLCSSAATTSAQADPAGQTATDSMANNLATQSKNSRRFFFSAVADPLNGGAIDSAATIRPFIAAGADDIKAPDGTGKYSATEVQFKTGNFPTAWADALNITNDTCTKGRAVLAGGGPVGTEIIPALVKDDCMQAVWGFAGAYPGIQKFGSAHDFNVRCGGSATGKWSVSGGSCILGDVPTTPGDVCIPSCAALGAIYHANPVVVSPPSAYSRDEGYNRFQTTWRTRQPVVLAATTDGILHAFKAIGTPNDNDDELWAFAPPAVLPRLATNYPLGNQVLLDGTPAVADIVWNRTAASTTGAEWHTTLVGGLGSAGGGYYALNITDTDCSSAGATASCYTAVLPPPTKGLANDVSLGGVLPPTSPAKAGPHFLWQLTDVPTQSTGNESAKLERASNVLSGGVGVPMRALFGKHTSTPALGIVQIGTSQVGVAILPGGYEDPPDATATCPRDHSAGTPSMHNVVSGNTINNPVRKWASLCTSPGVVASNATALKAAVPGRGVTIVRLDTGEILRHFGRAVDVPLEVQSKLTAVDFDSPMVGTPVVYPNSVGVPIQKIFIGDADGTMWRIDVSNVNPASWNVALFQDLAAPVASVNALFREPIQVAPVLSTDDAGNVVINVATGDQDSIVYNPISRNFVYSLTETRDATTFQPTSQVNWYQTLVNGQKVTGPMTVFNRNLYFATYAPTMPSAAACTNAGSAQLWGLDFIATLSNPSTTRTDVVGRWCAGTPVNGVCPSFTTSAAPPSPLNPTDIIPGVTLQANASCAQPDTVPTDVLGSTGAFSKIQPVTYNLAFGSTNAGSPAAAGLPQASRALSSIPTPMSMSKIDSWSIVIE